MGEGTRRERSSQGQWVPKVLRAREAWSQASVLIRELTCAWATAAWGEGVGRGATAIANVLQAKGMQEGEKMKNKINREKQNLCPK